MTTFTQTRSQGTSTVLTKTANIDALADGEAKVIGVVDVDGGGQGMNYKIEFKVQLGSSVDTTAGELRFYILQYGGQFWTDEIDVTSDANQAAVINNALSIGYKARLNSDIIQDSFDLGMLIGDMPDQFAILLLNDSGDALHASNHEVYSQSILPQASDA